MNTPSLRAVFKSALLFLTTTLLGIAGTAHAQGVTTSPASPFNFGVRTVNTTTSQVFTVTAVGPAKITAITAPTALSRMTITGGTCAANLTISTPCTLAVSFNPLAAQGYSGFIRIDYAFGTMPATPLTIDLSGSGVAAALPTISLTPAALAFGSVVAGTLGASQTFTVRNSSAVNATVSSISQSVNIAGGFIQVSDGCTAVALAANQTCLVTYRFTPSAPGNYSGTVSFFLAGSAGPAAQGTLAGSASAPPLTAPILAPLSTTFPGIVTIGASAPPQVLTLSNPNPSAIAVVLGLANTAFIQTNTCGANLAANASCTVTVTFAPNAAGTVSANLTANTSAGNVSAVLTGTGALPQPPTLTPSAVNFGSITLGQQSRAQVVTLINPNAIVLPISAITSSSGFSQTNTCGGNVAAGSSCAITIIYSPSLLGASSGIVQAVTPYGNVSATLSGIGAAIALLPPEATPDTLNFAAVTIGSSSAPAVITVRNPNTQAINISGFNADAVFVVSSSGCTGNLAAAQTCVATVTFRPNAVGLVSSVLTLSSSAGTDTVSVSGTGVALPAAIITPLMLSPNAWDFGRIALGAQSSSRSFTLQNTNASAASPLQITASASFTQSNNCGLSLAPGASCQINVQFTASVLGVRAGTLLVSVAGAAGSAGLGASATLSGTGIAETPIVAPTGVVISTTPRFMQASMSAATSQFITYSFTPGNSRVTAADGIFCTSLTIPVPITGATAQYPCARNSEFARHPTDRTTFQTVQQAGNVVRATETIRVPSAVTRAAQGFAANTFYFVRRFEPAGFAVVEIRATGAVVNAPVTLNDVRLGFETSQGLQPLVFVARGDSLPPVRATLFYTGSGVLRGRWELVLPGDTPPTSRDLLTEASLPKSERGTQRRYQLLQRFEQFLPGIGRIDLTLPSLPAALAGTNFAGQYQLLLRIEAEPSIYGGESGAAAFAMPLLRYFVGSQTAPVATVPPLAASVNLSGEQPLFSWLAQRDARYYRVEVADGNGNVIASAIVRDTARSYRALSGFSTTVGARWRVTALDEGLRAIGLSEWIGFDAVAK